MDDVKKLKRAIRAKCLDCSGGIAAEVALCGVQDCPLFAYRMDLQTSFLPRPQDENLEDRPETGKTSGAQAQPSQFKLF